MKIFITGIAGFLGSHLADEFIRLGHEVSGVDNLIGGERSNVPSGAKLTIGNCLDHDLMLLLTKDVDVVYHCACTAYEGLSVFSPHFVTLNTYQITMSVLSAAIQNKVKRFVFCSSMARYGAQETPFHEDMTPMPQDPYGIAKYASELSIKNLCATHGIEWNIAVPHNIIGPRQKYDDPYRNVASIMINRMLQGQQPIIYGDGQQERCFSFVRDVVDPLVKLGIGDRWGEIVNVGPDEEFVTINELAKTIAELLDFDLQPIYVPDRPQEVKRATCSSDKARSLLGYRTTTTLKEGLLGMIGYIKNRGVKEFDYHLPLEIVNERTPKTWTQKII